MALHTFYLYQDSGLAPAFEVHDIRDLEAARRCAARLLADHASCVCVAVYEDDQEVLTLAREASSATAPEAAAVAGMISALNLGEKGVAVIGTTLDGAVAYWSPEAARLYGWPAESALGQSILELTPALQARDQAADAMATLQMGRAWEGEIALRARDGRPFLAYVLDIPLQRNGTLIGIVGLSVREGQRRRLASRSLEFMARVAHAP